MEKFAWVSALFVYRYCTQQPFEEEYMSLRNLIKYKAKDKELLLRKLQVTPCFKILSKFKSIFMFPKQFLKQNHDVLKEYRVLEKWYLLMILKGLKYSCPK